MFTHKYDTGLLSWFFSAETLCSQIEKRVVCVTKRRSSKVVVSVSGITRRCHYSRRSQVEGYIQLNLRDPIQKYLTECISGVSNAKMWQDFPECLGKCRSMPSISYPSPQQSCSQAVVASTQQCLWLSSYSWRPTVRNKAWALNFAQN